MTDLLCSRTSRLGPDEVDEAALDVGRDQFDTQLLADGQALEAVDELAFDGRIEDTHPRSFLGGSGNDRVETLADAPLQEQGGGGLAHLPLDLVRGILLLRAVSGELFELHFGVRGSPARERRLEQ